MFNNGFDFFKFLVTEYGKEEAVKLANNYLDIQIDNKDPEEFLFCCELYRATQQVDKYF